MNVHFATHLFSMDKIESRSNSISQMVDGMLFLTLLYDTLQDVSPFNIVLMGTLGIRILAHWTGLRAFGDTQFVLINFMMASVGCGLIPSVEAAAPLLLFINLSVICAMALRHMMGNSLGSAVGASAAFLAYWLAQPAILSLITLERPMRVELFCIFVGLYLVTLFVSLTPTLVTLRWGIYVRPTVREWSDVSLRGLLVLFNAFAV